MAKKKPNNRFKTYEGRKPNDIHIRLTYDMLMDEACLSLSPNAFKLYCYMKLSAKGSEEFEFPYTYAYGKFMNSRTTISTARQELIDKGFIELINKTSAKYTRQTCKYKFISDWSNNTSLSNK